MGVVLHRSDYCFCGMFRDLFLFRKVFMLRILYLQVVVTMALFFLAKKSGLITLYPPPNLNIASLGTLLGGIVFGTGMVMAGGCVIGTLYKMGSGNITSIIAFAGLIIGSSIYAEIYPVWKHIPEKTTIGKVILLPQLTGDIFLLAVLILSLVPVLRWIRLKMLSQKSYADGYIHPWKVAIFIALLNLATYIGFAMPMAVSTGFAKISAYFGNTFFPEHFETLSFFKKESFSVIVPDSGEIITGGPGAKIDHIFTTEIALIFGVIMGAFISAVSIKEFKFHNLPPMRQSMSALFGGILLATGSRMAGGCNVKFLMSGLPLLSVQAFLFLLGMLPGVWIGAHLLQKWVIKLKNQGV